MTGLFELSELLLDLLLLHIILLILLLVYPGSRASELIDHLPFLLKFLFLLFLDLLLVDVFLHLLFVKRIENKLVPDAVVHPFRYL